MWKYFACVIAAGVLAYLLWRPLLSPPARPVPPPYRLDRRVPEITFDGQNLSDVLDFYRDIGGVSLFVDWRSIEVAGLYKADATVKLHVANGVKECDFLDLILANVGDRSVPLTWWIDDGYIAFSTREAYEHAPGRRPFDVKDLVTREDDPITLAFGHNPFRKAPPTPQDRADALIARAHAKFGPTRVPIEPPGPDLGWKGNPPTPKPDELVLFQFRTQRPEVEAFLDAQRRLPGQKAFALRAAALLTASLLTVRLFTSPRRRRRDRLRRNQCIACGYDVRASPSRCPECGTASPGTNAWK